MKVLVGMSKQASLLVVLLSLSQPLSLDAFGVVSPSLSSSSSSSSSFLHRNNDHVKLTSTSTSTSNLMYNDQQKQHTQLMNQFTSTALSMANKDDDDKTDNNDDKTDNKPKNEKEQKNGITKLKKTISKSYKKTLLKFIRTIPTLKVAFTSFTVGILLTITLIFVPVYNSVDKMSEPVTLFETILTDLDQGYVDAVDTKKLFETGVSAMLNSLDPYTEFESRQEAKDLNEGIMGRYAGVGLVISGANVPQEVLDATPNPIIDVSSTKKQKGELLPEDAKNDNTRLNNKDNDSNNISIFDEDDILSGIDLDNLDEDFDKQSYIKRKKEEQRATQKAYDKGVRVINAFEGYAFDAGMRPGDKIVAVDGWRIGYGTPVESVRGRLRGEPGTSVDITFERDGLEGEQTLSIPRNVIRVRDVKLTTFVGNPEDAVGYIQLSGFTANAGAEVRQSIFALQQASEEASNGEHSLQGLILDLRGNPGGLLTSAVDVSSLLVPKGSEIVSAKGRGFPGVSYRSRVDPILDPKTKLAVLINDSTASAAEIVSGAVQDLDVGVIVGSGRSFGKGLVQNVEELPFDTALKFTVAKYYTPSGRCIQSTNYKEGGGGSGSGADSNKYQASKVAEKDKMIFYTKNGREVKDGGGIAVDYKVAAPKASALEVTLLRSGIINDFASEWSKKNQITNNFEIDDKTYRDFQNFVMQRQKDGDIKLDAFYARPIEDLQKALNLSGYKGSSKEVDQLRANILNEMRNDFDKYKVDIKEDLSTGILSRYLPESMLIERSLKTDIQVAEAAKLVGNGSTSFDSLLARETTSGKSKAVANKSNEGDNLNNDTGAKLSFKW